MCRIGAESTFDTQISKQPDQVVNVHLLALNGPPRRSVPTPLLWLRSDTINVSTYRQGNSYEPTSIFPLVHLESPTTEPRLWYNLTYGRRRLTVKYKGVSAKTCKANASGTSIRAPNASS